MESALSGIGPRGRDADRVHDVDDGVRVLIISGSMGAGKTTVLGEASTLLTAENVPHAAIDVDAVSIGHVPSSVGDEIAFRNVATVWANYATLGISRLLLADAIDTPERLLALRRATRADEVVVGRLCADLGTMQERVRVREPVSNQAELVENVERLQASPNNGRIENFSIVNDGDRPIAELTREMLIRAGRL